MPNEPLPFWNAQASGQEVLAGASPVAMNVVRDATGTVRRRPCIQASAFATGAVVDAGGIIGLYATVADDLYAVGNTGATRKLYKVTAGGATSLSASYDTGLTGTRRPNFAETELLLVLAGGGDMQKVHLPTVISSRLGGSPPQASHVAANASRLLANDVLVDLTKVRYSDFANGNTDYSGLEHWSVGIGTAGFFSAEARPDPIVALAENTNEIFVFGSTTLQIFSSDASSVFAPSATRELGCAAAYSVVKVDQNFAWLDHLRRFVVSDGRSLKVISDALKETLDGLATVSDCYGFRVILGPVDVYVWTFPTDGRTFAYQVGVGWAEWSGWSDTSNNWEALPITAHALRVGTGQNLVGTTDGHIGELSLSANSDLGERVPAYVETGFINRGTDNRKHSRVVRMVMRRGESVDTIAPVAFVSWRDQPGAWGDAVPVSVGTAGDTTIVVELRSLGVYRRRQWRFQFSDSVALTLVSATEEFDVLDS